MCETNPISGLRMGRCGLGADLRRDAPWGLPAQGPVVQTNPIGRSELCKTNPICRSRRRSGGRIVQNEPNFGPSGLPGMPDCAKRTQFSAGPGGTKSQGRRTRGKRAKRSQFGGEFQASGVRFEAGEPGVESSDLKLYTSNFQLDNSYQRQMVGVGLPDWHFDQPCTRS